MIDAAAFGGPPINPADGYTAARLPPHHRDPFDRMLIAQAGRLNAVIVTRDPALGPYAVEVLAA